MSPILNNQQNHSFFKNTIVGFYFLTFECCTGTSCLFVRNAVVTDTHIYFGNHTKHEVIVRCLCDKEQVLLNENFTIRNTDEALIPFDNMSYFIMRDCPLLFQVVSRGRCVFQDPFRYQKSNQ